MMFNLQHMAAWVPPFNQAIQSELSLRDNTPPFITFQLATINTKTGFPSNRTLVYRGWLFNDKTSNIITFATDKRMAKYDELVANDKFEAVFYFEKAKKQFRFRGNARIIDNHHTPIIDLSFLLNRRDEEEDDDDDDEDDEPVEKNEPFHFVSLDRVDGKITSSDSDSELDTNPVSSPSNTSIASNSWQKSPQKVPIASALCSPTALSAMEGSATDLSYSRLAEFQFHAPTKEDWDGEIKRQWGVLSKNLKQQLRKPAPLTPMSDENLKQIDKIRRGVDGKKDEDGFKNFAVVALFIDHVDFVELDKDRRFIYNKDCYKQWNEQEVCP